MKRDNMLMRPFWFQLGRWKVLQSKLLPLAVTYKKDQNLLLEVMKLITLITMPPEANGKISFTLLIKSPTLSSDGSFLM